MAPLAVAVPPATLPTPTLPFSDVSAAAVARGLAGAGPAILAVAVLMAWIGSGAVVAGVLGRRGHDWRRFIPPGATLGPLMLPVGLHVARRREPWRGGVVVAPGRRGGGPLDVLVGVVGGAESAAAAGHVVELLEGRIGRLTLARVIDHQSAEDEGWNDGKASAAVELVLASSFFAGHEAELVLVAGPAPSALLRYASEAGFALVLPAGGPEQGFRGRGVSAQPAVVPIVAGGKGSG